MIPTKAYVLLIVCLFKLSILVGQTTDISGKVIANSDVDRIHIINKTSNKFTTTDDNGVFTIPAALNDTILISAIQYKSLEIKVNQFMIQSQKMVVNLTEKINELDEVIVGKVLTGDLTSDVQNSDAKADINFYDVGIPGYTGKRKTQKERRLYDANHGKYVYYYGLLASININKILNKISGRTKRLKNLVRLEQQDTCMQRVNSEFSDDLFGDLDLEDHLKTEFFYYASEDPKFLELCKLNSDIKLFEFLAQKLLDFNNQVESTKD
ncbi:carboxypeptidase-like regulatory domain-containing protein [uncultured Psychroserpens sp.]|uniref:carboxypeptidase-like regulatory domain-containing protein n=1 Tax=uncultured Psychroserpens sp. TaxID=255436 RepID=UPI00260B4797|nr:carboxypeptidase-like regulatory domain-containing protein [uncultured Psychroserpens sp.]